MAWHGMYLGCCWANIKHIEHRSRLVKLREVTAKRFGLDVGETLERPSFFVSRLTDPMLMPMPIPMPVPILMSIPRQYTLCFSRSGPSCLSSVFVATSSPPSAFRENRLRHFSMPPRRLRIGPPLSRRRTTATDSPRGASSCSALSAPPISHR